jgi:gamma-D-glutamyl-L-lysine dipeptidyl-peptidase
MIGICTLSNIPLRKEANSRSEMVSTILFGETYNILHQDKEWTHITTLNDMYQGFISTNQISLLQTPLNDIVVATGYPFTILNTDAGIVMAPFGAQLPDTTNDECSINGTTYAILSKQEPQSLESVSNLARQFLNVPYLWGGKTAFGIDCSGLVQVVYKAVGVQLPRDAYQQAEMGGDVSFLEEVEPGDLAFFDNEEGRITHVGLMLSAHQIIHASGKVRIDPIDSYGIMNRETQQYSHKLRIIKRMTVA